MVNDCCCVLFTKPARPGRVKTRLIGALTSDQAAALHQAFLEDILLMLAGRSFDLRIAWAMEAGEPLPKGPIPGMPQSGKDLGARLFAALEEVSTEYPYVMALGSDHPEIELSRLEEAFSLLGQGADLVLGPASDGGYYLTALRRSAMHQELFDGISWSSSSVLSETLDRSRRLGLEVELLAEGDDVDSPEDLERLIGFLAENPDSCRRTGSLLREWGRLE
jgi:rSAM/selenodomain-associated transferase 1